MSRLNVVLGSICASNVTRNSRVCATYRQFSYYRPLCHELLAKSESIGRSLNNFLNVLSVLFAKQCNAIVAQRIRRTMQMAIFFRNLGYDHHALRRLIERIGNELKGKQKLFLLSAALFSWDKEKITDKEIREYVDLQQAKFS